MSDPRVSAPLLEQLKCEVVLGFCEFVLGRGGGNCIEHIPDRCELTLVIGRFAQRRQLGLAVARQVEDHLEVSGRCGLRLHVPVKGRVEKRIEARREFENGQKGIGAWEGQVRLRHKWRMSGERMGLRGPISVEGKWVGG